MRQVLTFDEVLAGRIWTFQLNVRGFRKVGISGNIV